MTASQIQYFKSTENENQKFRSGATENSRNKLQNIDEALQENMCISHTKKLAGLSPRATELKTSLRKHSIR